MDLQRELSYAADPYAVFAMMTDHAFLERRAIETKAIYHEVTVEHTGDGARTRTERSLRADMLPDAMRKLAGDTVELTETTVWAGAAPDGSRTGTVEVEVARAPVHMRGTIRLEANRAGTRQDVQAEIKSSVPLIGGKVEAAAAKAVNAALDVEERLGGQWLSGEVGPQ